MSKLLVKPSPRDARGQVLSVTPESAGWGHVGFEVFELAAGESLAEDTGGNEVCIVLLGGRVSVQTEDQHYENIGDRDDVFEDKAPYAVYVPNNSSYTISIEKDAKLAVCRAPGQGNHKARLITPDMMSRETRGEGSNTRHVCNILPEDQPADSLLVVEVKTPSGNWSSYPPHKHDSDRLPDESFLEETYYHRMNPPQGYAFQRVYTDDRSLDETMAVEDGDVVMVPEGYHPVGVPHGYDNYYLNVMAGPKRIWRFHNEPAHEWLFKKKP